MKVVNSYCMLHSVKNSVIRGDALFHFLLVLWMSSETKTGINLRRTNLILVFSVVPDEQIKGSRQKYGEGILFNKNVFCV